MLRTSAKRQVGPSKTNIVTCSTCFIRCRSGSVLRTALLAVFAVLQRDIGHLSTSFDHQLPVVSAFRSDIKREDYGNFIVVNMAMNRCGRSVRIMA
jgi:hypothetical protein